jgi:hypothetical protein
MDKTLDYLDEYKQFIDSYRLGEKSGEEIGLMIARFAQYFAMHNLSTVELDRKRSKVAAEIEARVDDNGKAISSAKAQSIIDATDEAHNFRMRRAHLQNVEQMINAMKSLQKGSLNEYSHLGNS